MRKIDLIVIHCSDSDIASHDNVETIDRWHKERGFNEIGYHYYIDKAGEIHNGRSIEKIGAHCKGKNSKSVGICLGGRDPQKFTDDQYESLAELCCGLQTNLGIHKDNIRGHYEYSTKQCPNFNVEIWKEWYLPLECDDYGLELQL